MMSIYYSRLNKNLIKKRSSHHRTRNYLSFYKGIGTQSLSGRAYFRIELVYNLEKLSERVKAYIDVEQLEYNFAQKVKETLPTSKREVCEG